MGTSPQGLASGCREDSPGDSWTFHRYPVHSCSLPVQVDGGSARVVVAFATKLRMAAVALGCDSRKEFCARFRSVNRASQCDLDRLNKWMQGRSLPRAASVYADLAAVIGTAKPGRWVAESSLEEFAAELTSLTGADAAALAIPDNLSRRNNPLLVGLFWGRGDPRRYLRGLFAGLVTALPRSPDTRRLAACIQPERRPDRDLYGVACRPRRTTDGRGLDRRPLDAFRVARAGG